MTKSGLTGIDARASEEDLNESLGRVGQLIRDTAGEHTRRHVVLQTGIVMR